jgi:tetratricopeptide (TPR) repeat protein
MTQLSIQQAFDLALQHHYAGRLSQAEQIYRQILTLEPNHFYAMHQLGLAAYQLGRDDDALDLLTRAIGLNPNSAEAHNNLGDLLRKKGRTDAAIAECRRAIALKPDYPEAHNNLGNALKDKGRLDEAIACFRGVIALNPNLAVAHYNLGNTLKENHQLDEAIAAYRQALLLNPNFPEAHNNLGYALRDKGELDEAIASCRCAIALRPDLYGAHNNLGIALKAKGRLDQAEAEFEREIGFRPEMAEAHHNLSFVLLLRGEFERGWDEYEWRWKCRDLPAPARNFTQPRWDGSPLESRSILIRAEQGFGDTIQFVRYLPMVAERGGKIILECQGELHRLFRTLPVDCQITAPGDSLPPFDFHFPLPSLPQMFKTDLSNIPKNVPYLASELALVDQWSKKLGPKDGRLRVGLAWAGNPKFRGDRWRSMKLEQLRPLTGDRGVRFYSLQKGRAGEQVKNPPAGLQLIDLGPELSDFADTAAVMSLMDLIITTDTSIPHLAGALARPVWVMLQFVPDFRWLLDRQDCPWYPTMRLFRQPAVGDWDSVVGHVVNALSSLAG